MKHQDMTGRDTLPEGCEHSDSETCPNCCECRHCVALRSSVIRVLAGTEALDDVDDAEIQAEMRRLTEAMAPEKELLKERLGFSLEDLPDAASLTKEEIKTMLLLLGVVSTAVGPFNDAGSGTSEDRNPIVQATIGQMLSSKVGANMWAIIRDLLILVCRMGLLNPGLFSYEEASDKTGTIMQAGLLGLQTDLAMGDAIEMLEGMMGPDGPLEELTELLNEAEAGVEADSKAEATKNPLGGRSRPAMA